MTWTERLGLVFQIDITTCPECGGRLRWIADVTDPSVIRKILHYIQSQGPPLASAGGHEPPKR